MVSFLWRPPAWSRYNKDQQHNQRSQGHHSNSQSNNGGGKDDDDKALRDLLTRRALADTSPECQHAAALLFEQLEPQPKEADDSGSLFHVQQKVKKARQTYEKAVAVRLRADHHLVAAKANAQRLAQELLETEQLEKETLFVAQLCKQTGADVRTYTASEHRVLDLSLLMANDADNLVVDNGDLFIVEGIADSDRAELEARKAAAVNLVRSSAQEAFGAAAAKGQGPNGRVPGAS